MAVDTSHSILRSARSFLAGTALSRISGFLRDIAMAVSFGSSPEIAAFLVSYRLANLFRRLLGEGNLQAGFVPHFVELKEQGAQFYRDVTYSMGVVLLGAMALLEALLWASRSIVPADWLEVTDLTMWMVPGLFFICLYGLNSSLLQCRKKYFLPAVAPVAFNLIWIATVLLLPGVKILAIAITIAFAAQWLVTFVEGAKLLSFKEWCNPHFFSPDFKKLLKPLALGVIGIGAVQFNSALDAIFSRIADLQGPAFLWYAIRLQQLPLSLFGIALSGALLPSLARTEDPTARRELLLSALKSSAALMLVCSFGIFALGLSSINLLYGHGDFTPSAVQQTCHCLWAYGLGLLPSVFVLLLAAKFYAEKDYKTPTTASLLSVLLNIALNALFVFVFRWGAISIAIATSLSAFLNLALLARGVFPSSFFSFFLKMPLVTLLPAIVTFSLSQLFAPLPRDFPSQLFQFAMLATMYFGGVVIGSWLLGLTEPLDLVRRKKNI
jgi:putative peptidoglycan lipid II flippase